MRVHGKAKDSFYHQRQQYAAGDPITLTKGEADDMVKSGLIELTGEHEADDDLLGDGKKMEAPVENKMEKTVSNKSVKK